MTFGEHDLGARAPFPRIDLILCRNVLIYFTVPMQRAALETFGFSLRDGGRLVLGPSETVAAMPGLYDEDQGRLRVYRRAQGGPPLPLARALPARPPQERARHLDAAIRSTRRDVQVAADSTRSCREAAARPEPRGRRRRRRYYITRINTAARRMLGIHGLAFDQDFIHLAESLPSTAIRTAIDAALGGKTTTAVYEVDATDVSAKGPISSRRSSARMAARAGPSTARSSSSPTSAGPSGIAKRRRRRPSAGSTARRSSTGGCSRRTRS